MYKKKSPHFLIYFFFQEENRGLRLKEELVVAAEKLQQPSAMAAYPEEENLRYIFWRDPQSEQTPKNQSKRKNKCRAKYVHWWKVSTGNVFQGNLHIKCWFCAILNKS